MNNKRTAQSTVSCLALFCSTNPLRKSFTSDLCNGVCLFTVRSGRCTIDLLGARNCGSKIIEEVKRYLKANGILHLDCCSVPDAWRFYWNHGFRVNHRRLFRKVKQKEQGNFHLIRELLEGRRNWYIKLNKDVPTIKMVCKL